jgi:hypothetical protein
LAGDDDVTELIKDPSHEDFGHFAGKRQKAGLFQKKRVSLSMDEMAHFSLKLPDILPLTHPGICIPLQPTLYAL